MAENKKIIRILFAKVKESFLKLTEEEQQEFMRKDREKLEELGYKLHFMLDCSWSTDEWQYSAIEEWPSMEAIKKIEKFHEETLELSKYVEYKTYLGTFESDEYTQEGITNK